MKTTIALLIALTGFACAQDKKSDAGDKAAATFSPSKKPQLTQSELEAKFIATMTKATMTGRWCLIKDGQLTPEKSEKYTIVAVKKLSGDSWVIQSRIQYNQQDFVVPIPVKVQWAGDTPVIIVDNLAMPGGATAYSARVLVYQNTYAGTWSGGDNVGLLNGVITQEK